jgi:hypothetical protein
MLAGLNEKQIQSDVLQRLKEAVDLNMYELKCALGARPIGTIAWNARNLLELAIWSEYSALSQANAKEFLLDAARDAADILDIPDGLLSHGSGLRTARQGLLDKAKEDGFDIEEDFTRVATAAKRLGRGVFFKHLNKIFSKFAHPTAIAVIQSNQDVAQLLSEKYHKLGMELGEFSLRLIAQWREREAEAGSTP